MHLKSTGGEIGVYLCPESEQIISPKKPELTTPPNTAPTDFEFSLQKFLELEEEPAGEVPVGGGYNFAYANDEGLSNLFIY